MTDLRARAVANLPEIRRGDDLAALILDAGEPPQQGDVVVVAHKVVSKAEGRVRALAEIRPSPQAVDLGLAIDKDPRQVQAVLDESAEVLRAARGVLIVRTRQGFVCANAGVDASNAGARDTLVLLPADPDASARALRARLAELSGQRPAVLITDSFGRAWRHGQCDVAIGCAGLSVLDDWRGRTDRAGRKLQATWIAVADEIAGAADLARAKDSGLPVVIVSGLDRYITVEDGPGAAAVVRPVVEDLFA